MSLINVAFQYCGMVNMILLLLMYFGGKRLGLRSERMFIAIMLVTTVCLVCDISSIYAIAYLSRDSILLPAICKTYLATLIIEGASAYLYVMFDFNSHRHFMKIHICVAVVLFVEILIIALLPISYYNQGGQMYTYNKAVEYTYYFTVPFVVLALVMILIFRSKINKRRIKALICWMALWMVAAVIQFLNNEYLLVGFACSLGMIILYVILENPEANFDRQYGFFNSYAMSEFLKQKFDMHSKFNVIVYSFEDEDSVDSANLKKTLKYLNRYKHVTVFKRASAEVMAVYEGGPEPRELADDFDSLYKGIIHKYMIICIPDAQLTENCDNLFNIVETGKQRLQHMTRRFRYDVTRDVINDFFHRGQVEAEIVSAIAEDRVEVYLQPIFSCATGGFASAEALARIRKRDGSMLFPGSFIPVAEETGRIVEIGDVVFEKTCAFLQEYREKLALEYIEVNLSVVQCERTNLADKIIESMEKYQIDPSWINLEITESAAIAKNALFMGNMKKLLDYGVRFSLDDFGKGESNLMYLIEMPVSIVKFDIDMMKAYHTDAKAHQVIDAMIEMVHSLKLSIVAEGIETADEMEDARQNGIDYIQGYYFSKPLPLETYAGFVQGNKA